MQHIIFLNNIDVSDGIIYISKSEYEDDYNHLVKSLRIKEHEKIKVDICTANKDESFMAEVISIESDILQLKYIENINLEKKYFNINLYQGTPKSDKMEFIIEKSTELGVASITPVNMKNSIKILDSNDKKKFERFNKISHQASLQSMRHDIPKVNNAINFKEMLDNIKNDKYNIIFYEREKDKYKLKKIIEDLKGKKEIIASPININIIIGPEGGFSDQEISEARSNNIDTYSLGDMILRTETASIVALSIINYIL